MQGATYLLYRLYVDKRLITSLGKYLIRSLRREHVIAFLDQLLSEGVGNPTVAAISKTIKAALQAAVARGLIPHNVAAGIRPPRIKRKPFYVPDESELREVLDAARGDRYEAIYGLGAFTSMRQGEIFGLAWQSVYLESRYHLVEAQLGVDADGGLIIKGRKTNASYRRIELPQSVVEVLGRVPSHQRHGLVFIDAIAKPLRRSNFLRRQFFPLFERAGVRGFRFHALRHAGNSILLDNGESMVLVKERGGLSLVRLPLVVYGPRRDIRTGVRSSYSIL